GKDASSTGLVGGVKVALLDVADPANPKELATRLYGKAGSASALDSSRHGINLFKQGSTTRVALPVRINEAATGSTSWFDPSSQGLVRLEVNHTTRTLADKPTIAGIFFATEALRQQAYGAYDVGQERSVQIGAHVYYLSGGMLRGEAW
ncbi:MAG TPA: beta-propeller domain-containing protein, partial [Burkholderiaceae bacterium]|nr:beta-propeller domain-containing protein [Burkholderiaceae bacterium]